MQTSGECRREKENLCSLHVIARSKATRQFRAACMALDCRAEPVIGPRFARTRRSRAPQGDGERAAIRIQLSNSALRHCEERSDAAIQSRVRGPGLLRRSAPRNDGGENMRPHPRGAFRPSFAFIITLLEVRGRREGRVAAAPGALAQKITAQARKPQVQAVTTGLPCAMVHGLYALSSVNLVVCHRPRRDAKHHRQVSAGPLGRQDHTISLVRLRGARQQPRPRPPLPASRLVTTANRPSVTRRDG